MEMLVPVLFDDFRLSLASKEVAWIIRETRLSPPARVLDVGCGIGRHTHVFSQHGFDTEGIDASKTFLRIARKRSRKLSCFVRYSYAFMHQLKPWYESFDLCLNLFSSFGYYKNRRANFGVIQEMVRTLRRGGMFVLDTVCREGLEASFCPRDWKLCDNGLLLEERLWDRDEGRLFGRWILYRRTRKREFSFAMHVFSRKEILEACRQAGLSHLKCFGSLQGSPLTKTSFHLVVVGQKRNRR